MKNKSYRITGDEAVRLAERDGLTLRKYNDPTEDARSGLTPDEARDVIREDPHLIYVDVVPMGWTGEAIGYNVSDYFRTVGVRQEYQGPDDDGIEPTWADAEATE